jgi:Putative heavy-metal-binding
MFGGELAGMTKNLAESRNEAMARLIAEARSRGGNTIVAMRFDTTEIGEVWTTDLRLRHRGSGHTAHRGSEIHGRPAGLRRRAATTLSPDSGAIVTLCPDGQRNLVKVQNGRATVDSQTHSPSSPAGTRISPEGVDQCLILG